MNSWEDGMVRAVLLSVVLGFSGCRCAVDELDSGLGEVVTAGEDAGTPRPPPDVRPSGCWSQPIVLADPSTTTLEQLVALPGGDALFVWLTATEPVALLGRVVSTDGRPQPVAQLVQASPWIEHPIDYRLTANAQGQAALVWSSLGPEKEVLVRRFHLDAGWGDAERVSITNPDRLGPSIVAVDGLGRLTVAWSEAQGTSGPGRLMVRREGPAGWLAPEVVTPPGAITGGLALRASDELTVLAWAGYFPPTFKWTASTTTWTTSDRIEHQFPISDQGPGQLSLDVLQQHATLSVGGFVGKFSGNAWEVTPSPASGRAFVVLERGGQVASWWEDSMPPDFGVSRSRLTPTGWTSPEVLERDPQPLLSIVAGSGPRTAVAWTRLRNTLVHRSGIDGGLEVIERFQPTSISVGTSGAIWMVGTAAEAGPIRSVALVCP